MNPVKTTINDDITPVLTISPPVNRTYRTLEIVRTLKAYPTGITRRALAAVIRPGTMNTVPLELELSHLIDEKVVEVDGSPPEFVLTARGLDFATRLQEEET